MKESLRRSVERLARKFGCHVIPEWRMERLAQTQYLQKLFAAGNIDCVFDVGANIGQYAEYLRMEVGYKGWIVSFEPVPKCIEKIQARAESDPRWIVRPCALGREAGTMAMNVMRNTEFSSFLKPAADENVAGNILDMNKVEYVVDVEVSTLAHELHAQMGEHGSSSPYLKLDTQGFDPEVTAGAGDDLKKFKALQTEMSIVPLYDGMPTIESQIHRYSEAGFAVGAIFPNNPEHFPRMVEFDCHFVNEVFFPPDAQR